MASIAEPVPLALNLSTAGSKVHASETLNCKNEAVLAIGAEGLFIHSVPIHLPRSLVHLVNRNRLHRAECYPHLVRVPK